MNRYEKFKIEILSDAQRAHEHLAIRTHELALKYGIDHRHVCEKLAELHTQQLIRLSAWNEQENRDKPFDEWSNAEYFFAYASDGTYKRVRLLVRGAEYLENAASSRVQLTQPDQLSEAEGDRAFARLAIEEARKSVPENDGRPHPWVGAIVVKDGRVLSRAHRGELSSNHAEYIALEKKLSDEAVAGATVYTTLEPCTTRNHPKIPCAARLIERKVARVLIGMLDPDDRISGRGWRKLRSAGIVVESFPPDLVPVIEELNRDFTRFCEAKIREGPVQHGRTSGPDVLLTCAWRSMLGAAPIVAGAHVVRNRFWSLSAPAGGPLYNVQIREIDFGKVFVSFAPVDVLSSDAQPRFGLVFDCGTKQQVSGHDLESLLTHPPDGCDIAKYTDPSDPLLIEIPIAVEYGDASGDQYAINYVLKYEVYSEEGRIIRKGGITKLKA